MTTDKRVILIQDDTTVVTRVPFDGKIETVRKLLCMGAKDDAEFAERLDSTFIERIKTPIKNLVLLVDEDGRRKQLPTNHKAMLFYGGPIFGPAVLTYEEVGSDEEWIGVPDSFDFELVAECAYQRICATLGEHPFIELKEADKT